jgi:hypothetical protein
MRLIYYQVCCEVPDGYGMSVAVLSEFPNYEAAEQHCLNDINYYNAELFIRKVYK